MPLLHPAQLPIDRLLEDCDVIRTRRSGPGGQHRNKVETAIVIVHRPTGIRAEASERRSQVQNRTQAIFRLRVNLAVAVRTDPGSSGSPSELRPSELWRSRCVNGPFRVSPEHDDFPAILAEALDVIAAVEADVKQAATLLGCTPTRLLRLLQTEPRAIRSVNEDRERRGLHKMR